LRPSSLPGTSGRLTTSISLTGGRARRPAGVVKGGPLGFLPEGVGEGVGVSGHGPGQGAVAGPHAEVGGEVVLVVPDPRVRSRAAGSRRGRRGRPRRCRAAPAGTFPRAYFRRTPRRRRSCRRRGRVRPPWRRAGAGTLVRRRPACRISRSRLRSNGTVRYQDCPDACCRHARIGRWGRVMRRIGQAASRSQVLRCRGCSGVEKAIPATTTP